MHYLGARASQIGTKHDSPRSLVRELLTSCLETIFKQLEVTTTTVTALLVLDFVLDNQRFVAEVDGLVKGSRDSVVSSLGLCDQTLVTLEGGF